MAERHSSTARDSLAARIRQDTRRVIPSSRCAAPLLTQIPSIFRHPLAVEKKLPILAARPSGKRVAVMGGGTGRERREANHWWNLGERPDWTEQS